jgi:hypothetical protein
VAILRRVGATSVVHGVCRACLKWRQCGRFTFPCFQVTEKVVRGFSMGQFSGL